MTKRLIEIRNEYLKQVRILHRGAQTRTAGVFGISKQAIDIALDRISKIEGKEIRVEKPLAPPKMFTCFFCYKEHPVVDRIRQGKFPVCVDCKDKFRCFCCGRVFGIGGMAKSSHSYCRVCHNKNHREWVNKIKNENGELYSKLKERNRISQLAWQKKHRV